MTLVLDASVILKWLLKGRQEEADTELATLAWEAMIEGRIAAI